MINVELIMLDIIFLMQKIRMFKQFLKRQKQITFSKSIDLSQDESEKDR